jgi:PRC-barrel domain
MRLSVLAAGTAFLLCSSVAMAQTNTPATQPDARTATTTPTSGAKESLRMQVRDMMQKAGFTDIHVAAGSLLIRAKDKDGNPVLMNVSPDSLTEVAEVGSGTDPGDSSGAMSDSRSGSEFVTIPTGGELSSNLVGLDVYNNANKDIGQIKDIAMGPNGRTRAYIVSVGGFLGVGEHYVAVNPSSIKVSYNSSDKKWHATMDANANQLKAAPEFKYNGRWNASKS